MFKKLQIIIIFIGLFFHLAAKNVKTIIQKDVENDIQKTVNYIPQTMREFVVIIPSYNNKDYYERNLDSLQKQAYGNWKAIYIDDQSPDGTAKLVETYIKNHNLENKITLVKNEQRQGALANLYYTINTLADNVIAVLLDGDDRFAHENVLSYLNQVYDTSNVLLTYGNYDFEVKPQKNVINSCARYSKTIIETNSFRKCRWCASHLRTFYAGLFKKIKQEDLMKDGVFFPVAWDLAIMLPMLEMAGGRFTFIPEVLYIYNNQNPLNDSKQARLLQKELSQYIQNLQPYTKITEQIATNIKNTLPQYVNPFF